VSEAKFPPVPTSRDLTKIAAPEFAAEIADAVAHPYTDREGTAALLSELLRRCAAGEIDHHFAEVARGGLEAALASSPMDCLDVRADAGRATLAAELIKLTHGSEGGFLFHGTLVSRLLGIARDGLVPRKRARTWGRAAVDAHAATGVFFTKSWRTASDWVGAAAYDSDDRPTKGAVIRIPSDGLTVEPDRFATAPGAFVVRQEVISVANAYVMLWPFSVTSGWMELRQAVELTRRKRRVHSAYKTN
jgi:hypothetical protein